MGRRIPLRALKAQAQQTMAEAQGLIAKAGTTLTVTEKALLKALEQFSATVVAISEGVEEVMDGVELEGQVQILGQTLPAKLQVKLKLREDDPGGQ